MTLSMKITQTQSQDLDPLIYSFLDYNALFSLRLSSKMLKNSVDSRVQEVKAKVLEYLKKKDEGLKEEFVQIPKILFFHKVNLESNNIIMKIESILNLPLQKFRNQQYDKNSPLFELYFKFHKDQCSHSVLGKTTLLINH